MELALEVSFHVVSPLYFLCFNPCYYGIGFRRKTHDNIDQYRTRFNPCYYGIGFRSYCIRQMDLHHACFNPCYYGIGFRSRIHAERGTEFV